MKKITTLSIAAACLLNTNVLAQDNNEDLNTVTVYSATKSEQSIQDITSNINVISAEEIEEKHYQSVGQALNSLSGISMSSNGGLGQLDSLYLRGMSSKRILILIDGIRYNEPAGLSGAPLAQLTIDDVERIEVIKGAQSGIWGADASAGVINVITKKAKKDSIAGSLLTEVGSFNTKKISANLSGRADKVYGKINFTKISTDGYSAFEAKQGSEDYGKRGKELGYEKDGYENSTYTLESGVNITDNDSVDFSFKNINAQYDYDSTTSDNLTNKTDINHYFKAINYKHVGDVYSLKISASQSRFNRTQNTFNAQSLVNEFSILNTINYRKNDTLVFGFNKQNFEDINNDLKYQTKALFASNLNKFGKLTLSETIRYDDNNNFDDKVTAKLGIKYDFTKDIYLSSNYGSAYTAPTLSEFNTTSSLVPETTKSFDISFAFHKFQLTYFNTKITNMIDFDFSPSFYYFNEKGTTALKGFELEYEKSIFEDLLLTLNYTRLSAKNDDGDYLARRPKETVKASIDYYGIDKLHLGINGEYVGERYNSANEQGAQTGRYTVINLVANYDITNNINIYAKINNITDRYYQTIDGYSSEARAYYAGLKYSF